MAVVIEQFMELFLNVIELFMAVVLRTKISHVSFSGARFLSAGLTKTPYITRATSNPDQRLVLLLCFFFHVQENLDLFIYHFSFAHHHSILVYIFIFYNY